MHIIELLRKIKIMNKSITNFFGLLNFGLPSQTDFYITYKLILNFEKLNNLSLSELAILCDVSASRIKKYFKNIGYSSFAEFKQYNQAYEMTKYQLYKRFENYPQQKELERFVLSNSLSMNNVETELENVSIF